MAAAADASFAVIEAIPYRMPHLVEVTQGVRARNFYHVATADRSVIAMAEQAKRL